MKKTYSLCVIALIIGSLNLNAQVALALWDFRVADGTGSTAVVWVQSLDNSLSPDSCGTNNTNAKFNSEQTNTNRYLKKASDAIDGYAISTNWGNPTVANGDLYWYIYNVNTKGYDNIGIRFQQWSSNTGAGRFDIQARVGSDGIWTKLNTSPYALTDGRTVTTKYFSFPLPAGCADQDRIDIRIIRADDYQVNGTTVIASGGMSRIDNIRVYGEVLTPTNIMNKESDHVKVTASNNKLIISEAAGSNVKVYNLTGSKVLELQNIKAREEAELSTGHIYIVKVNDKIFKTQL